MGFQVSQLFMDKPSECGFVCFAGVPGDWLACCSCYSSLCHPADSPSNYTGSYLWQTAVC